MIPRLQTCWVTFARDSVTVNGLEGEKESKGWVDESLGDFGTCLGHEVRRAAEEKTIQKRQAQIRALEAEKQRREEAERKKREEALRRQHAEAERKRMQAEEQEERRRRREEAEMRKKEEEEEQLRREKEVEEERRRRELERQLIEKQERAREEAEAAERLRQEEEERRAEVMKTIVNMMRNRVISLAFAAWEEGASEVSEEAEAKIVPLLVKGSTDTQIIRHYSLAEFSLKRLQVQAVRQRRQEAIPPAVRATVAKKMALERERARPKEEELYPEKEGQGGGGGGWREGESLNPSNGSNSSLAPSASVRVIQSEGEAMRLKTSSGPLASVEGQGKASRASSRASSAAESGVNAYTMAAPGQRRGLPRPPALLAHPLSSPTHSPRPLALLAHPCCSAS